MTARQVLPEATPEVHYDRNEVTLSAEGVGVTYQVVSRFTAEPAGINGHGVFVVTHGPQSADWTAVAYDGFFQEWHDAARYVIDQVEAQVQAEGGTPRCGDHGGAMTYDDDAQRYVCDVCVAVGAR